jgi:hypothetical protein
MTLGVHCTQLLSTRKRRIVYREPGPCKFARLSNQSAVASTGSNLELPSAVDAQQVYAWPTQTGGCNCAQDWTQMIRACHSSVQRVVLRCCQLPSHTSLCCLAAVLPFRRLSRPGPEERPDPASSIQPVEGIRLPKGHRWSHRHHAQHRVCCGVQGHQ